MSILAARHAAVANGRDAADAIRSKVIQFRASALPRVASVTENAGEAVSKIALSTSKNVAGALRRRAPSRADKLIAGLPLSPFARSAARFVARNPAILAVAGVGIATLGYFAWRLQREEIADTEDATDALGAE